MKYRITFEDVKSSFEKALRKLGVDEEKIYSIINENAPIKTLGLCNNASLYIEVYMQAIYPKWRGFIDSDTINTIWEYNKDSINNNENENDD